VLSACALLSIFSRYPLDLLFYLTVLDRAVLTVFDRATLSFFSLRRSCRP
jgi:hypothetical protein